MKQTFFSCALIIGICAIIYTPLSGRVSVKENSFHNGFKLSFTQAGMGSNRFYQQPAFRVKGTAFVFTMEDAWIQKNVKPGKPKTLCTGNLRSTSIDSIIRITEAITDTIIYVTNPRVMSGAIQFLTIQTANKKLEITMHNESDSNATKIVAILNSNLPEPYRLYPMERAQVNSTRF